jgi:Flagellar hook-length control protein FliK
MSISLNPVFPVIGAQGASPDLVLQPGTVIDARVVRVLDDNLVRIAIGSLSIDVLTEVPLQVGATLKLAVSQMPDGVRLAIVSPTGTAPSGVAAGSAVSTGSASQTVLPTNVSPANGSPVNAEPAGATSVASPATDVSAILSPRLVPETPAPAPTLTPVQALAVMAAAQAAATKQIGLSTLFADASAAVASKTLPEPLQQAALQLLAARPALTTNLTGNDVKSAFLNSGLFLESSLASGSLPQVEQGGPPDLKAALVVFRQVLATWLGEAEPDNVSGMPQAQFGTTMNGSTPATVAAAYGRNAATPEASASLAPDIDVEEVYLPKALLPVAEEFSDGPDFLSPISAPPLNAAARAAGTTAALNVLQEAEARAVSGIIETIRVNGKFVAQPAATQASPSAAADREGVARTNVPPPPFRDGAPAPQPVAAPSLAPDATPVDIVRHLMDDADGAIARHTLLQIASLPDRVDASGARIDPAGPRWNFEIPFVTPLGTAVAQFEISRDDAGKTVESAQRVWRARFTLDVEPAGPVHAVVSLAGETTSVRLWAERSTTAEQMRDNAFQLTHALRLAELEPGDIVIGDGTPPVNLAPAGLFLDRAT